MFHIKIIESVEKSPQDDEKYLKLLFIAKGVSEHKQNFFLNKM